MACAEELPTFGHGSMLLVRTVNRLLLRNGFQDAETLSEDVQSYSTLIACERKLDQIALTACFLGDGAISVVVI